MGAVCLKLAALTASTANTSPFKTIQTIKKSSLHYLCIHPVHSLIIADNQTPLCDVDSLESTLT